MTTASGERLFAALMGRGTTWLGHARDVGAGLLALARAGGLWLWGAGGEIKAAFGFAMALMVLTVMPKPAVSDNPLPSLRSAHTSALQPAEAEPAPYAREPWRAVRPALAAYRLEAPELGRTPPTYRIRSLPDGSRQDLLVLASSGKASTGEQAFSGAVSIEQDKRGRSGEALFVDAARRAALIGASIERMAQSTEVSAKFGTFEVADAQVIQNSQLRSCLVFRLASQAPIDIQGLLCGEKSRPADRATLTCVLDRIDLLGAGEDIALRSWFAGAERARQSCAKPAQSRSRQADKTPGLKQVIFEPVSLRRG